MMKYVIFIFITHGNALERIIPHIHEFHRDQATTVIETLTDPNNTWLIIAENNRESKRSQNKEHERCIYFTVREVEPSEFWDGYCYYMPSGTEYSFIEFVGQSGKLKNKIMQQGVATSVLDQYLKQTVLKGICTLNIPFFIVIKPEVKNVPEDVILLLVVGVMDKLKDGDKEISNRSYKTALLSTSKLYVPVLTDVLAQVRETYFISIPEEYNVGSPEAIPECTHEVPFKNPVIYS